MKIVLLQCELQHRHQAPHLAGALFLGDLRRAGHEVRAALVHPSALHRVTELGEGIELLVLDSIFPFALQRQLKSLVSAPLLVGGHNALQHLLRGPADYALVGPARSTLPLVLDVVQGSRDPATVPGLWFRQGETIHCGPPSPDLPPGDELHPFSPEPDWEYLGPPRAPGSNLRLPSVVAEFGCVWNRPAADYAEVAPRAPALPMSPAAQEAFAREFLDRAGGCTFCTFRYQPRRGHRLARATELVVEQVRVWLALGARGISLQSEHPLPLLMSLLDALKQEGLAGRLDELHLRTIPWLVLRHEAELRAGIARARDLGIRLVLAQVGFEAFDAETLTIYNKGLSVQQNLAAAELLTQLTAEHPGFEGTSGHGLVPLHPYSTPEALRETLAACRRSAPWLLPSLGPFARIELYNEWNPLFWKLQDEGLLRPAPDGFGWGWRYADPRMEELTAASASILAAGGSGAEVLERVCAIVIEEPDPQARRGAYLALREELRVRPPPLRSTSG